jgi:hypothetical protein
MLFLKRIATSAVLFVVLFIILFIGSLAVGGAIAGARAGSGNPNAKDFQSGYEVGQQAGADFARRYTGIIFLGSFGASVVGSLAISFSGVLPWCRRAVAEPPRFQ